MHVMKSLKIVKWECDEKQGRNCWVENLKEKKTTLLGFLAVTLGQRREKEF